jgi:hypothetical protein
MKRTFEIKFTITTTTEEACKEMMKIKNGILSGAMQRECNNPEKGISNTKITFREIE